MRSVAWAEADLETRDARFWPALHLEATGGRSNAIRASLDVSANAGAMATGGRIPADLTKAGVGVGNARLFLELNDSRWR